MPTSLVYPCYGRLSSSRVQKIEPNLIPCYDRGVGIGLQARYTKEVPDTASDSIAYPRTVPVGDKSTVFVVGGGPAGIAAAIASARQGALV